MGMRKRFCCDVMSELHKIFSLTTWRAIRTASFESLETGAALLLLSLLKLVLLWRRARIKNIPAVPNHVTGQPHSSPPAASLRVGAASHRAPPVCPSGESPSPAAGPLSSRYGWFRFRRGRTADELGEQTAESGLLKLEVARHPRIGHTLQRKDFADYKPRSLLW
ncbi:hypothetical protein ACMD2_22423 [Ananas comosus]|uniref:Uncharacterized protein n=1 Tax=Ananas comosus TaxID=4615 RepID=A0A199UJX7_ANACO|nr:hypothetical protein ACMD2_22423 [Ananas comosus]